MLYITIDGGTTNTRICLTDGNEIRDKRAYKVGARAGMDNRSMLKETVKNGIKDILSDNRLSENDIAQILASGMITSEFGLCELSHITVPAGISELHNSMKNVVLEDISPIPFTFICGVKTPCTSIDNADMMRGEETELMGIISEFAGECVYVLPGSHSKIIKTDKHGRITGFTSMLTGEMAAALSQNTILKDAVDFSGSDLNEEYLLSGFDFCRKNGINNTLFKVRILKNIFRENGDRTYSFFLGAVLCDEILEILKHGTEKIIIGGNSRLKEASHMLLKHRSNADTVCITPEKADIAASVGMVKIFEY